MRGAGTDGLAVAMGGAPVHGTAAVALAMALVPLLDQAGSQSIGSPARGSLRDGVSLPAEGVGFVTYSRLGNWLGRQYVHSRVRDTLVAAFSSLHAVDAERLFVVGETGLQNGGRFRPHRSHQNGLSVDIFMPVRDGTGRWVLMPTAPWQKFGYSVEFNAQGSGSGLSIDFSCLAELLLALDRKGQLRGLVIERIIVAPEYVDRVLGAKRSEMAGLASRFMRRPAWVRHDEHVHVDFRVVATEPTQ